MSDSSCCRDIAPPHRFQPRADLAAVLRVRRAFARVVPRLEFAVGVLEGVRVESAVVLDEPTAHFHHIERCGFVAGLVPSVSPGQHQVLPPSRERLPLAVGILLDQTGSRDVQISYAPDRFTGAVGAGRRRRSRRCSWPR